MVHTKIKKIIKRFRRRRPKPSPTTTGGQSRPSGPVVVTGKGKAVGTAKIPTPRRGGGGRTTTGGQSRPSGPVVVTGKGKAVGTAKIPTSISKPISVKTSQKVLTTKTRAIQIRKKLLKVATPPIIPRKTISKGIDVLGRSALKVSLRLAKTREELLEQKEKLIREKGIKAPFSREGRKIDRKLKNIAVAESITPFALLPSTLKFFVKNPKEIKNIPAGMGEALKKEGKETGRLMLISPSAGFVKIGAEVFTFKGTGKALSLTGKVTGKTATRLSPKFSKIKDQKLDIPSKQPGEVLTLKIARPLKKGELVSLKEQVKLAGRKTTVVSAQADRLVNLIRTRRVIRKPIPNEKQLKSTTKKLLQKFDKGDITRKELIVLDNRIKKETKGAGSILERSFFGSPGKKLRVSRLGQQPKDATLLDILKGKVSFRTQKPQILIFEDIKIQKFPKALNSIKNKLKSGKTLTKSETDKLLKFQLKESGKFKPIGALTKEPEVTLAPGEIIKKERTIAVTLVNGKRVPIVRVKVVKAKPETKKLLEKSKRGDITTKELNKLRSNLRKETGFKPTISRSGKRRPVVKVKRTGAALAARVIKRGSPRRAPPRRGPAPRPIPRGPPRPPPRRGPAPRAPPRRITISSIRSPRPPPRRGPAPRPIPRGPPKGPPRIIPPSTKRKKKKKESDRKIGYDVFGKSGKRFIKLNKVPLSRQDAKSRGKFAIDHTTSKTLKIKPAGAVKKFGSITKPEKGYSGKVKFKFREFRIKKGKRKATRNTFIEKRKFGIDTSGEKRQLSLARWAKQRGLSGKRIKIRKGGKK